MDIVSSENEFLKGLKKKDPIKNNIVEWDDEKYYTDTKFVSNSMLGKLKSGGPQTLKAYIQNPGYSPEKAHNIYGRAFHCALLEPNEFNKRFWVLDDLEKTQEIGGAKPRSTKKYKEWAVEQHELNKGKDMISISDYNDMMRMQDKIYSLQQTKEILEGTLKEIACTGKINGVNVKCKTDVLRKRHYSVDLKGIKESPTPRAFTKCLYNYSWLRQAAFYKDILKVDTFWFLAVEKTYPYTVGLYEISEEKLQEGRDDYMRLLDQYNHHFIKNKKHIDKFLFMERV